MQEKSRESNYELMRIISMIFIVLYHILLHGTIVKNASGTALIIFRFIEAILFVHVNSFVLLSGYFQSEKEFKMSKLIKVNNQVWFYRTVLLVTVLLLNIASTTRIQIFLELLPIRATGEYWFFGSYILLYCLSPFLNKFIKTLSKRDYHKLLVVLFIVISLLPTLTGQRFFDNHRGYSLTNFIFLYFIGAYLKKYPLNTNYIFNRFTLEAKRVLYFGFFFFLAFFNLILYYFSKGLLSSNHEFTTYLSEIISNAFLAYDNPIVILQTIFYFSIFSTIDFKNKMINKLSGLMFGVYLIHDNSWIRNVIYKVLGLENFKASFVITFSKVIVCGLIIFIVCSLLEYIRQKIFQFIYRRKISEKWRTKYRSMISKIGIDINW